MRGVIPQVRHTYSVVDLMNEHQVAIGETTFDGREELQNPDGLLHYWDLINLGLQRVAPARELTPEGRVRVTTLPLIPTRGRRS